MGMAAFVRGKHHVLCRNDAMISRRTLILTALSAAAAMALGGCRAQPKPDPFLPKPAGEWDIQIVNDEPVFTWVEKSK